MKNLIILIFLTLNLIMNNINGQSIDVDKVSYCLGVNLADAMKKQNLSEIDAKSFGIAFKDIYDGKDVSFEDANALVNQFFTSSPNDRGGFDMPKVFYSFGIVVASNVKSQGLPKINHLSISDGFSDMFEDKNNISVDESNSYLNEIFGNLMNIKKQENLNISEKFLADNKNKDGVITTKSGLQYKVLLNKNGSKKPTATSKVNVHYHGTLTNGDVFDSSVDRGEPITFGLNQVIPAWTEGVQLMSEGDKFRFFVHPNLGYGERGAGAKIGPNVVLIFDVELIKIEE